MSELTQSEKRFETLCHCKGIAFERVAQSNEQTPDYDIELANIKIAVEVKELVPNENDKRVRHELATNRSSSAFCRSDERLREKIRQACKQLKRRTLKQRPGVLIVYNNGSFDGIDYTDIKNAMYGNETWTIRDFSEYTEIAPRLGAARMCTPNQNTTLSGIMLMDDDVVCFHNVHAACPIDPAILRLLCVQQFTIDLYQPDKLPEWMVVQT